MANILPGITFDELAMTIIAVGVLREVLIFALRTRRYADGRAIIGKNRNG